MRIINSNIIIKKVAELCIKANTVLRPDILTAIKKAEKAEKNKRAKNILKSIIENADIAKKEKLPICQDTGMVVVFCKIGEDVKTKGSSLTNAINKGVRQGYKKGFLRKSVVNDPILRKNTNDNTPAIVYFEIVKGSKLEIIVAPKGFGCENMSAVKMFNPTASIKEIKGFVIETVKNAGSNACPPFVIGVGLGGTQDKASLLAKKAICRNINRQSSKKHIAKIEAELLREINSLNIGPMGIGGKTTVLGVNIETFPTHIAGLPVAVSISCYATRSAKCVI